MGDMYLEFFKMIRGLDHITRFSNQPRALSESVAAHSYFVAMMSAYMTKELIELGHKTLSLERVTLRALQHDVAEAVTGDILYPVKKDSEIKEKLRVVEQVMLENAIPDGFPRYLTEMLFSAGDFVKGEDDDEGAIVKFCDMAELVHYSIIECEMGNQAFIKFVRSGMIYCLDLINSHGIITCSPMAKALMFAFLQKYKQWVANDEMFYKLEEVKWDA